jgi:hypothetical protein
MVKCVNLIEIQFYASSFLVLWDQCADAEVELGGKYGYLMANMDICPVFALRANSQHWLLAIIGHAKTSILQQNMW